MRVLIPVVVCNLVLVCSLVAGQAIPPGDRRGPCAIELARVNSQPGGNAPGSFVPSCTANGYYNAQQTSGSTGYSWCVDPETGQELPGTRVPPGSASKCSKCLIDMASSLPPPGTVGAFMPTCNSQGKYEVQQFHGSTGFGWCVDPESGQELPGSRVGPGQGSLTCPKCLEDKASIVAAPGAYIPKCSSKGYFEVEQSDGSGYSWCVDPENGQEIPGTRVPPTGTGARCPRCLTNKAAALIPNPPPGSSIPKCDAKGDFELQQTNPSTGYSWCVDPQSGLELPGSRVPPGSLASCSKCLQEQGPANKPPGSYTPQCDSSGNYKTEQIHPSTGYRWCVDAKSGIERPGSRIAPGEHRPGWNCN